MNSTLTSVNNFKKLRLETAAAVEAIKDYKRGLKALYRDFYMKRKQMDDFVRLIDDPVAKELIDCVPELDTSEIFYAEYKMEKKRKLDAPDASAKQLKFD